MRALAAALADSLAARRVLRALLRRRRSSSRRRLTADTTFAFQGVSQYDFSAGVQEDVGLAAAVDDARGRTYAAGYTQVAGATQIAIVARRTDGSLDTSFAGDGSLELIAGPRVARDRSGGAAGRPPARAHPLRQRVLRAAGVRRRDRRPAAGRVARSGPRPGLVRRRNGRRHRQRDRGRTGRSGRGGRRQRRRLVPVGRRHPEHHRPRAERRRRGRGRRLGSVGAGAADRDADGRRGARGRRLRHGGHRPGARPRSRRPRS